MNSAMLVSLLIDVSTIINNGYYGAQFYIR